MTSMTAPAGKDICLSASNKEKQRQIVKGR